MTVIWRIKVINLVILLFYPIKWGDFRDFLCDTCLFGENWRSGIGMFFVA